MRITEVGVGEPPRIGGERKLQILRWGAAYYFQFWYELFYWRPKAAAERRTTPLADGTPKTGGPAAG
jgi:hypothetical protein